MSPIPKNLSAGTNRVDAAIAKAIAVRFSFSRLDKSHPLAYPFNLTAETETKTNHSGERGMPRITIEAGGDLL